jgi:ubiquinone/menaquinone biosynthesis C-methylase UbiE
MGEPDGLQRVDDAATGAAAAPLDALDALPDVAARRQRMSELLGATPGDVVVDVGCGTGAAVRELAAHGVRVIGVDVGEAVLDVARERARLSPTAEFVLADAAALPLDDGSVDGYRAERLFAHLTDPAAALAEARRVLAPGGRIVLQDQDWDALIVAADDDAATRAVVAAFARSLPGAAVARRFHDLLLDAGFEGVVVEAHVHATTDHRAYGVVAGLVAEAASAAGIEAAEAWAAEQRRRGEDGRFWMAMLHCIAAGTAPGAAEAAVAA